MSDQHTKGKIEAFTEPEFSGWWALREQTYDGRNHELGSGDGGLFEKDARRLAAAWNACEGLETEHLESLPVPFAELALGDLLSTRKELAAVRALLCEAQQTIGYLIKEADGWHDESRGIEKISGASMDMARKLPDRIRSYLDASDKQGGGHV